mmetsp:Transcript_10817/g.34328  ORF Transcript_10817/g.34328 Transcript_10817/m.34328 type:complete len:380 (-) Transcript_10817:69-1208(-)|eukprot:CAMPEP_0204572752 /NCGR_PEP_ID=MMETSP0661-20131031/39631_1 /ASSEMBLY_ACC=CAM_ASM_000606 /TAXON_ID=109239 /ORGANISM="Alexandrium margalefi, Strain AMGDE01CS-322" /LENGTH=379 /DNA_ID=CAMNT_0051581125 /DNA_START=76 /DNA_END=1215 /DNA_ORIENTATION=-
MLRAASAPLLALSLCGLCTGLRFEAGDSDDARLGAVVSGQFSEALAEGWAQQQQRFASDIYLTWPKLTSRFKILVVSSAHSTPEAVANFEDNLHKLQSTNAVNDTFDFALFHHDGNASLWESKPWYNDVVVSSNTDPLCLAEAWYTLDPALVKSYDYVWLLDADDYRMDYFSWDMYRMVLTTLSPLVSQPAILPSSPNGQPANLEALRMKGRSKDGYISLAREVDQTQSQATLFAAHLWDAVHERLGHDLRKTHWCVGDVWDVAAHEARRACKKTGPVVVDAAPLRRMHDRSRELPQGTTEFIEANPNKCFGQVDCPDLTASEMRSVGLATAPFCGLPSSTSHHTAVGGMRPSISRHLVEPKRWVTREVGLAEKLPMEK